MRSLERWRSAAPLVFAICVALSASVAADEAKTYKIGVLAKRSTERCSAKWGPTVDYLNRAIDGHTFELVPLAFSQVFSAVQGKEVDFILANPSQYAQLEILYNVSRLATLKNLRTAGVYTVFAGVIFRQASREDIQDLDDLEGKTFMAVGGTSLGGWLAAWRELKERGIDPHSDLADLQFGGTHDAVVYAVRDGEVDAGTVRTDTLERMAAEGKIRVEDFQILTLDHIGEEVCEFPFLHSTDVYPEWPMARAAHTSDELAEKVAAALLAMPADSSAAKAARCAGWTIPHNYQAVHECLRELRVGVYEDYGKVTLGQSIRQHWYWLVVIAAAMAAMSGTTAYALKLNRRLKQTWSNLQHELTNRKRAEEELKLHHEHLEAIFSAAPVGLLLIDEDTVVRKVNGVTAKLVGKSTSEMTNTQPGEGLSCIHVSDDPKGCGYGPNCSSCPLRSTLEGVFTSGHAVRGFEIQPALLVGEDTVSPWLDISLEPITIDGKKHVLLAISDITERKQAEEQLLRSEAKFRTLYDCSGDAVMLFDERGFFDCNDATLRIFGCKDSEEFCSKHPADLSPAEQPCGTDSLTLADEQIAAAMRSGSNHFEWTHKRVDTDTPFPAEVLLNAMDLDDKHVLQAVVRDVTERKQAEDQLRRHADEMGRFNRQAVGREERMIELKREVNDMARKAGIAPPYDLAFAEAGKGGTDDET